MVGDTTFKLRSAPDTVRGPDIAFISSARLPDPRPVGCAALTPDLAVEVVSPTDRAGEVLAKVADWLNAGTRLVWVIDPERQIARAYRADGSLALVTADESLDGEDVVQGFSCLLGSVL